MKKVLFVANITRHIMAFHLPYLKWFKEHGYEVHVASNGEMEIPYCDKFFNLCVKRTPFSLQNIRAYKQLGKVMKENYYEIVHCHTPMGGVLARLCAKPYRKKGTRIIYTAHGFHFYKGAPIKNWLLYYPMEKLLSKYTDTIITINKEDYKQAIDKFNKPKIVYTNGIGKDFKQFREKINEEERKKIRSENKLNKNDIAFICVGELNKNKNQIMIIEAMKEIAKEAPFIKVLIAGSGSLQQWYEDKIKEYQLENNVILLGYRKDIPQLLKAVDGLISVSKREGLPVNVIEGMASGLPIIATKIRGNVDLVKDNENGFLVTPNNISELKKALLKMAKEVNRNDFGEKSAQIAIDYDIENVLNKVENVYLDYESIQPIRILQIIRSMNIGGAETFIMNIYRQIDRSKIQFDFLVNNDGKYDDEIKALGGNIYKMPYLTDIGPIRYVRNLKRFFRTHGEYKVVHSHIDQVSGIILQAAKKAGVPKRISHSHSTKNSNSLLGKIYKKYLQSKIKKYATNYFACGEDAAKWLYKDKAAQATIIPNGIDIEKFKYSEEKRKQIREELGINENVTLVGHVGRFSKPKNHMFLLDVFHEYYKKNENCLLVLLGDGTLKKEIECKIKELGIESKVKLMGIRKDTDAFYSAFDFMIFPSLYEGISLVLLEAQASGLQIFASDRVAEETNITNTMKFIELTKSAEEWNTEIEKHGINRNTQLDSMEKYNSKNIADNLQSKYKELHENA